MLTRVRHQIVRPWNKRPRQMALAVALLAVFSTSSAFAQCRGGSGGMGSGGMGGTGAGGMAGGGMAGMNGMGMASIGMANGGFGMNGQIGNGQYSIPSMMYQPIVDDHRQYVAERRALRAAKAEQARQRLAARKERPTKRREVAAKTS